MRNVYQFAWKARFDGELFFLTNEYIILFAGGDNLHPTIYQYSLLDADLQQKRNFYGKRGLIKMHTKDDVRMLDVCGCVGAQPYFAGLLDASRSIALLVTSGRHVESDIVSVFSVDPTGLVELSVSHHPAGVYSSQSHLTVLSFPENESFIIVNGQAADASYYCMRYPFHRESSRPDQAIKPLLTEEERKDELTRQPVVKVLNFAGVELVISHPTRPLQIVAEDTTTDPSLPAPPAFSLSSFGALFAEDEDEDEDENNENEDENEEEDSDEDDYVSDGELDYFGGGEDEGGDKAEGGDSITDTFTLMSLMQTPAPGAGTDPAAPNPYPDDNVE